MKICPLGLSMTSHMDTKEPIVCHPTFPGAEKTKKQLKRISNNMTEENSKNIFNEQDLCHTCSL